MKFRKQFKFSQNLIKIVYCLHEKVGNFLGNYLNTRLKPLNDTCWEAKIESVKAVYTQLEETSSFLEELIEKYNDNSVVFETQCVLDLIDTKKMLYILKLYIENLFEILSIYSLTFFNELRDYSAALNRLLHSFTLYSARIVG